MQNPTIVIPNGNSLTIAVTWSDPAGVPEVPTEVVYRVFDRLTGTPIAVAQTVPSPAADMEFSIPGSALPGDASNRRHLVVQVQAEFASPTDIHTATLDVFVKRVYPFA